MNGKLGTLLSLAVASAVLLAISSSSTALMGAETKAQADPAKKKKPPEKKLTGADLYAIHCNRCHPERYPTEWTSREWQTLMTHMRVRANLPATQAREILNYLKEESGRP